MASSIEVDLDSHVSVDWVGLQCNPGIIQVISRNPGIIQVISRIPWRLMELQVTDIGISQSGSHICDF